MNPIGYIDRTYNPIAMRCSPVSEGCANCWHLNMDRRLANNPNIPADQRAAYYGGLPVMTHRLNDPLHWRKPQRVAVQFMGDLFHESVLFEMVLSIFDRMQQCPQHTFLLLTKRPQRMLEFCRNFGIGDANEWPANIWAGVTVENQVRSDERIPILLQLPAAKRWVSVEPMLGPVDCGSWLEERPGCGGGSAHPDCEECWWQSNQIDWVVCGGETGPGARPMHPEWVRSVRDQCQEAQVPFWVKAMGGKSSIPDDLMIKELPE